MAAKSKKNLSHPQIEALPLQVRNDISFLFVFTSKRHKREASQWMIFGLKYSYAEARKILELKLLGPLSSNLMSGVIKALRNRTCSVNTALKVLIKTRETLETLEHRLLWPLSSNMRSKVI